MEILGRDQGMGGERGRMVFILSAAALSHPVSWKICVTPGLQLLVEPPPQPLSHQALVAHSLPLLL